MFLDEAITCWQACSTAFPPLGRQYSRQEQQDREILFDRSLEAIESELFNLPATRSQREEALARITSALTRFAGSALDLDDPCVEVLLRDGFSRVGTDLAQQARCFDSAVGLEDVLQACRNAWTACGLQALTGRQMQLTPAIFAYSMLYPYTDNYFDDRSISPEAKLAFSARFRRRLAGPSLPAENAREFAVWRLIELIEGQYERSVYPQVYHSLLAIHGAQEESLGQLHRAPLNGGEIDLLRLSFAKGGASVLADAALAAGSLTAAEARFAYHWGVLLQLGDDLQDLSEDRHRGSLTLFSRAADRSEPLDQLTNRTLHFAHSIAARLNALPHGSASLKNLLKRSSVSLLIRSAANAAEMYSHSYLAELEAYSPFGFAFLKSRYLQIARRKSWYERLFEALLGSQDAERASTWYNY